MVRSGSRPASVRSRARRTYAVGLVAAAAVGLAGGCSLGGDDSDVAALPTTTSPGGILTLLATDPIETWDPQRISDPTAASLSGRMLHRTLTAYAPRDQGQPGDRLVGDLATDTGTASSDLKSWTFTLRDDARWQDGSTITCADVRHGVARTFATSTVRGGALDALAVLAIPKKPDGSSTYAGPWATGPDDEVGRTAFESAVACDQRRITFNLAVPVADFDEVVTQAAFAPVQVSLDTAAPEVTPAGSIDESMILASNGPYVLHGDWDPRTGGTFVRNPNWSAASDSLRRAYPDKIIIETGMTTPELTNRVVRDAADAVNAVALAPAPAALRQQISAIPGLAGRSLAAETELVDYLALNVTSPTLATREIRQALAQATNRIGYAVSLGGPDTARPVSSVFPSTLIARQSTPAPAAAADPSAARAALMGAGMSAPVPLRVAYRPGPLQDKAMAALVATWTEAGFAPILVPITDDYFATISASAAAESYDVLWSSWAPSWGSASTVLPALFDSSLNLSDTGRGRDVGGWSNPDWNASLTTIGIIADRAAREKAWAGADQALVDDAAYIALSEGVAVHLAGSGVRNLAAAPHSGGTPDLAVLGVAQ